MDVKSPLLIALIGAIGGIVGGGVTSTVDYHLGLEANRAELLQEARREAYVEWLTVRTLWREYEELEAEGKHAEAEKTKGEFDRKGRAVMGKIATFGGKEVVQSLAQWYRVAGLEPCAPSTKNDRAAELVSHRAMRADLMPDEPAVSNKDMAILLLQCAIGTDK